MGEPESSVVGDHDEEHVGLPLDVHRDGFQWALGQFLGRQRTRVIRLVEPGDTGSHHGCRRQHAGDVECADAVLVGDPLVTEDGEQAERNDQRERDDRELQHENLRCEPRIDAAPLGHDPRAYLQVWVEFAQTRRAAPIARGFARAARLPSSPVTPG